MITEIVLLLIILGQIALYAYEKRENRILWDKYMKNLKAKNAQELRDLELTEKVKIKTTVPQPPPDLIPEEQLSNEDFLKMMREEHGTN